MAKVEAQGQGGQGGQGGQDGGQGPGRAREREGAPAEDAGRRMETPASEERTKGAGMSGGSTTSGPGALGGEASSAPQGGGRESERGGLPSGGESGRLGMVSPFDFNPFSMMRSMSEQMDRVFDQMLRGMSPWRTGRALSEAMPSFLWMPQIEMVEREGAVEIRMDVPGMERRDVQISLDDNALVVEGERRSESGERRDATWHSERMYGRFYRSVPLPRGLDTAQATATLRDGVLRVTIPMSAGGRSRHRVEVGE